MTREHANRKSPNSLVIRGWTQHKGVEICPSALAESWLRCLCSEPVVLLKVGTGLIVGERLRLVPEAMEWIPLTRHYYLTDDEDHTT